MSDNEQAADEPKPDDNKELANTESEESEAVESEEAEESEQARLARYKAEENAVSHDPRVETFDPKAIAESMSDEETLRLITFVQEEIKKAKRGIATSYGFGIVMILILAGYMSFALYQLNTALEPTMLAGLIGNTAEEATPDLVEQLETLLVESADDQAELLGRQITERVPEVFALARESIDATHTEYLPALSAEFSSALEEYIHANSDELKAFADSHTDEEFASYFVDSMMEELELRLDEWMQINFEGRDLDFVQENIRVSLLAMDETVTELLETEPENLTYRQHLQRRVLARLYLTAMQADRAE